MTRTRLGFLILTSVLTTACPSDEGPQNTQKPFRDSCRTVIDQPFPVLDADGTAQILALSIGGTETADNFANRGDIVVKYADTDRITVDMCRFTMASNEDLAEDEFDRLEIWASDKTGNPSGSPDSLGEDDCVDSEGDLPWRSGCSIRVWYDGKTQLARAGADLTVTIPKAFVYKLEVTTEDNAADADYQNRGDVCIENLTGSADVQLGSGNAYVILDEGTNPMPECPDADRIVCEQANWDPEGGCPCLASMFAFSQTKVTSQDASAADITVDLPTTSPAFWSQVTMNNEGQQTKGSAPACADEDGAPGARCDSCVDPSVGAFQIADALGSDAQRDPWRNQGSINYPGLPATSGAGYSVSLTSKTCQAVSHTDDPDDFAGVGMGSEQEVDERGNMTVCSGCIRSGGCDDLVKI